MANKLQLKKYQTQNFVNQYLQKKRLWHSAKDRKHILKVLKTMDFFWFKYVVKEPFSIHLKNIFDPEPTRCSLWVQQDIIGGSMLDYKLKKEKFDMEKLREKIWLQQITSFTKSPLTNYINLNI